MNNMELQLQVQLILFSQLAYFFFASGPRLYRARAGGREYFGACEYGHAWQTLLAIHFWRELTFSLLIGSGTKEC